MKARVIPRFPINVEGTDGITATIVNGKLRISHAGLLTEIPDGSVGGSKLSDNGVGNSKLSDMSESTIKGRAVGAGNGDPTDLSATQATAILNTFTSDLKGLAPASGGGTTSFLRADGQWVAPPSVTIASQAEAESGTNNTNAMTPLRTTQHWNQRFQSGFTHTVTKTGSQSSGPYTQWCLRFLDNYNQVGSNDQSTGTDLHGYWNTIAFRCTHRGIGTNASGNKIAISGEYIHDSPSSGIAANNGFRNYLGVAGWTQVRSGDGGSASPGNYRGAFFAGGMILDVANSPAGILNTSCCEFNSAVANGTIDYISGIQVAAADSVTANIHAAISISRLGGSTGAKHGILIGGQNASLNPIQNGGTLIGTYVPSGTYQAAFGLDLRNYTFSSAVLQTNNMSMSERALALEGAGGGNISLGRPTAANTSVIDFNTSGSTNDYDVRIEATGGSSTTGAGLLSLLASGGTSVSGALYPTGDGAANLGLSTNRWAAVWATNGTIQTSDARQKTDVKALDDGLADFLIEHLAAKSFKWKDQDDPGETEAVKVIRQKTCTVQETVPFEEIEVIDGKAVLKRGERVETREEPVFDEIPIIDESGEPVCDYYPAKLYPDGRVMREEMLVPRVHRIPVMEEVEEQRQVRSPVAKKNVRTHFGFIAQEVETVLSGYGLTTKDFAGVVKAEDGSYGLRYDQFIPILWTVVQRLKEKVDEL